MRSSERHELEVVMRRMGSLGRAIHARDWDRVEYCHEMVQAELDRLQGLALHQPESGG